MTPVTDQSELATLIPAYGGYRELQSYQMSEIVYDVTGLFQRDRASITRWCRRLVAVNKITPTATEGCMASGTYSEHLYGQGDIYS